MPTQHNDPDKKQQLLDELESLSPLLHRLKQESDAKEALQTPDGYFNRLPDQVFERLLAEGATPQLKSGRSFFTVWRNPGFRLAAAAAIAVLIAAVWFFRYPAPADRVALSPALIDIDPDEAAAYVIEHIDEYEPELIAQQLPPAPLEPAVAPQTGTQPGAANPEPGNASTSTKPVQPAPKKPDEFNFNDLSDEEIEALFRELAEDDILNML